VRTVTSVSLKWRTKTIKRVTNRLQSERIRNVFVLASTYGRTIALSSPNTNARLIPKTICEALPCSAKIRRPVRLNFLMNSTISKKKYFGWSARTNTCVSMRQSKKNK